jgi:predicted O-methyltransferase YrrM
MIRTLARKMRNAAYSTNLYVRPGHYYSPSTNERDRELQSSWDRDARLPGIDLRVNEQLLTAERIADLNFTLPCKRWTDGPENSMFGRLDATVLHGILSLERPNQIIEVGSGYSTGVMLDAADSLEMPGNVTCIEPYPERLQSLLRPEDHPEILTSPVQSVDPSVFKRLRSGDLLFIDSTHVAKSGSDVLYLYLEILPSLPSGVFVHVHDIFWPFSYRTEWMTEGRDWSEAYLLRALLTENPKWEIVLFNDWLWTQHRDFADRISPAGRSDRPGSIYLRRC